MEVTCFYVESGRFLVVFIFIRFLCIWNFLGYLAGRFLVKEGVVYSYYFFRGVIIYGRGRVNFARFY